jgi:hypothetical protein
MIPAYNSAKFLPEALTSVLIQDQGRGCMQIEVVDDCSTDSTESVVRRFGAGRVAYHRHSQNMGHVRTFNNCVRRSQGMFVHLLHGDDCVRDGFYRRVQEAFDRHPEVGAAFTRHIYMDEQGHWQTISPLERQESGIIDDWLIRIAAGQRIAPPSIVIRREMYERVGGYDPRLRVGEDWEMWVRVAAHTKVWFETEPLAMYRTKRAGSLSVETTNGSILVASMRQAVEILEKSLPGRLPPAQAKSLLAYARRFYAGWGIEGAQANLAHRRIGSALDQLRETLKCSTSPSVVARVVGLLTKNLLHAAVSVARWPLQRAYHSVKKTFHGTVPPVANQAH